MPESAAESPYTIVDADDSHLPGILRIYNHAVRETFAIWTEAETTLEQRRQWMEARRKAGYPVVVAITADGAPEDRVLAYGSYGMFRDFPGYAQTVEHSVYVEPGAQRRGVGRAIVAALVDRARAAGMKVMVGGIDAQNTASIGLHARLGFDEQGRLAGVGRKFGRSLDLVFMVKAL